MADNLSIQAYYEQQPYPDSIFHFTHPAHTGALAKLFGHPGPADPATARILDVGCGQGANLIRIARDLPGADCIGLDLAEVHIQQARRNAATAGLNNIQFIRADLLEYDVAGQPFDFIIAHGFFTWVPDDVRERLLSICRDHLTPEGLAVISYNCLPGWSARSGLRLLMQMENEVQGNSGRDLLKGAGRVLDFFDRALPAVAQLPHAPLLKAEMNHLRSKAPDIVLHDELEPLNDPQYLLQFAQWAQAHGLGYICDTSLLNDWLEIYSGDIKQALSRFGMNRMQALQYIDFLMNRDFRRSIVCPVKAGAQLTAQPDPRNLHGLWVASRLSAEDSDQPQSTRTYRFIPLNESPGDSTTPTKPPREMLQVSDALTQAFLDELAEPLGQFKNVDAVFAVACRRSEHQADDKAWTTVAGFILNKVAQGYLKISLGGKNQQTLISGE